MDDGPSAPMHPTPPQEIRTPPPRFPGDPGISRPGFCGPRSPINEWARSGPRRPTTIWGTWPPNASPPFGITHLEMRSPLRVAYPLVNIAGFGNNVITLAKAHCVAERCGLTYLPPRWPPTHHMPQSPDGYGHYYPLGPWDRLLHGCLRIPGSPSRPRRHEEPFEAGVRTVRFSQDDYDRVDIEDMG